MLRRDVHPDDDALADVVLGLDGATPAVTSHVAGCERCAAVLAEYRHTAELVSSSAGALGTLEAAPSRVWRAVEAELAAEQDAGSGMPPGSDGISSSGMPPTIGPAPQAGSGSAPEAGSSSGSGSGSGSSSVTSLRDRRSRRDHDRASRPRHGRVAPWAAGAAAAGVLVGLLGGHTLWREKPPSAPAATTLMAAPLTTLDTRTTLGRAQVVEQGGSVDLQVSAGDVQPAGNGYLEVWLINEDRKRMVSVGVLEPGQGATRFPVSLALMDEGYRIVDISREAFDDKPQHSGESLIRGTLEA